MQVMVLDQDQNLLVQLAGALMQKGFQVICVESIGAAKNFIRRDFIDVLVMGERVGGKLSHSLALLAECRNPLVSAILLTDRTGPSLEEIFDLIPSIYGILGRKISPDIVAQIVLASTIDQTSETVRDRLANRWAAAAGDEVADLATVPPEMEYIAEDLEAAADVESPHEPLPLLVLTDPQMVQAAFDLAGWAHPLDADGVSQTDASDMADDFDDAEAEYADTSIHVDVKATERPVAARVVDPFAPGWPHDGNRSPFYRAMSDLPFFVDMPEASDAVEQTAPPPKIQTSRPMPSRASRPMTPAELADRRMHLA